MDSEGNRIENNTIAYNTYGIYLKSDHLNCSNNTIDQNNVSMNEYGIFLNIEGDRGQNNMIFNNILIGNKKGNAFSRGEAKWDNGSIGNLYGDYRSPADGCSDSDGNGICDSPHKIRGSSSTDKYPIFEKSKLS
jgi:parallel beta-helix repeat protein